MTSAPTAFKEPGLWVSVWRMLRLRLVILVSGFRRAKLGMNRRRDLPFVEAGAGHLHGFEVGCGTHGAGFAHELQLHTALNQALLVQAGF